MIPIRNQNNINIPDLMLETAMGGIDGVSTVNKFGRNPAIASGVKEEIWDGSVAYVFPTTASITHIRTAADTPAMDGLLVEIQGLDANWNLVVQTATIDADTSTATEVALETPLIRVFRMKVTDSVTTTDPIWIGATGVAAATAKAIILTGNNQTLMAIYTVPAGKTAYMTNLYATINPATNQDPTSMPIQLWARDNANTYAPQIKHVAGLISGSYLKSFQPYQKFTEKTDIYVDAKPVGKAADVSAGFDLILVDNE